MTKFIQCEHCKTKISGEKCSFAMQTHVIDNEEHVFCCEKCAERFEKKGKALTNNM